MFDPDLPDNEPLWETLWEVVQSGDERALGRLIAENRPYIGGPFLWHLVDKAAELGQVTTFELLLEICSERDIDAMNDGVYSPLGSAAWHGHAAIARMLLAAGADPDAAPDEFGSVGRPKKSGRCALFCAMVRGHRDLVKLLEPVTSPAMRSMARQAAETYRST